MTQLRYKGFEGSAEIDVAREVCRGKILFIDDLVTYEARDVKGLRREFVSAVDDYLATCEQLGRVPNKPYSGVFNVRTSPDKHRALVRAAAQLGSTLNAVINTALDLYLAQHQETDAQASGTPDAGNEQAAPKAATSTGTRPQASRPGAVSRRHATGSSRRASA